MVWKYIDSQHERNKNKSILPSSFSKRSQYVLSRILYNQKLQEKNHGYKGKDQIPYGYPLCLTGEAWDAYANNPYDLSTRKEFLNTIQKEGHQDHASICTCIRQCDNGRGTNIKSWTKKDWCKALQWISSYPRNCIPYEFKNTEQSFKQPLRKPVQSGYLQFHHSIWKLYAKTLYLKIHGAYSKYVNKTAIYVNGCGGEEHIIPVTMFLVMLYNACFMYQSGKRSNLLITALDTFNLGASVNHEKLWAH